MRASAAALIVATSSTGTLIMIRSRFFWPTWFGHDNVFPSPDHLPWLQSRFQTVKLEERLGKVPYLPLKAPYYIFVGRKA